MSTKQTDYQQNGDTITQPNMSELTGYYREFGGMWVPDSRRGKAAVTIDHVVIDGNTMWCEINGTSIDGIMHGKLP